LPLPSLKRTTDVQSQFHAVHSWRSQGKLFLL